MARADRLPSAVALTPVGREVPLAIVRDGKPMKLTVKVGEQAEPREASAKPTSAPAKLGLTVEPVTPQLARELGLRDTQGLVIKDVAADSPADEAGLQTVDIIVEVDRHPVRSAADLRRQLDGHAKGTPVLMLVHRGDGSLFVTLTA